MTIKMFDMAYRRGYASYGTGLGFLDNPYLSNVLWDAWEAGFDAARRDAKEREKERA